MGQILFNGPLSHQLGDLRHIADAARLSGMPESALLPYGHIVQINRSGSGSDLPRDQVQQSAFPCAAAAGNKDKFLLFNGKVDLSHRGNRFLFLLIIFTHLFQADLWHTTLLFAPFSLYIRARICYNQIKRSGFFVPSIKVSFQAQAGPLGPAGPVVHRSDRAGGLRLCRPSPLSEDHSPCLPALSNRPAPPVPDFWTGSHRKRPLSASLPVILPFRRHRRWRTPTLQSSPSGPIGRS